MSHKRSDKHELKLLGEGKHLVSKLHVCIAMPHSEARGCQLNRRPTSRGVLIRPAPVRTALVVRRAVPRRAEFVDDRRVVISIRLACANSMLPDPRHPLWGR